jgi:integrase
MRAADRAAVAALETALDEARRARDQRPPFLVLASAMANSASHLPRRDHLPISSRADVTSGCGDCAAVAGAKARCVHTETPSTTCSCGRNARAEQASCSKSERSSTISITTSADSRLRRATYHRRFLVLRRFMRWVSRREGVPDPFLDLDAPPKPRQESDWLTPEEFQRMLAAAAQPQRRHTGIVERDQLVLLALVTTGLRRSELIALDWRDLALDGPQPSLLVRRGKGGKPRRQPIAPQLAHDLRRLREEREPVPTEPVFCGLAGGRLQPKVLAAIVKRAAERAGIEKRVTAHTLRHTAASWLRQATGDARLVAEYLGHADLTTVSRYPHVAGDERHEAAAAVGDRAGLGMHPRLVRETKGPRCLDVAL